MPVSGLGDPDVVAIAAGDAHTCALLANATVRCWGNNESGQLGIGTFGTGSLVPTPVSGLGSSGVTAITAGNWHTCALLADATMRCWGDNGSGQLGNDSTSDSSTPMPIGGLGSPGDPDVISITAGRQHTCALLEGSVRC